MAVAVTVTERGCGGWGWITWAGPIAGPMGCSQEVAGDLVVLVVAA